VRVAVKDLIDLRGTVTTAGCRSLERRSQPAEHDAPLLAGIRAAVDRGEVTIVGKTNLHELAFGADGINIPYGTPTNPIDPTRIPGGSSSGSAVAVATNEADIALGSDTGGSIRMPAACCGIVGLKTTWGRVPITGVWPLAPFLDTIGPMARTVGEVVRGMDLLEPGFAAEVAALSSSDVLRIGRAHPLDDGVVLPAIDRAVDAALDASASAGTLTVAPCHLPLWSSAHDDGLVVLLGEAWRCDRDLLDDPSGIQESVRRRLWAGREIEDAAIVDARAVRAVVIDALRPLFESVDVVAIPTLPILTPRLHEGDNAPMTALTRYANLAGLPALSLPVPLLPADRTAPDGHLPTSIQLIGAPGADAMVCAVAARVEAAVATSHSR
jgi:amidase